MTARFIVGDSLTVLRSMPDASVDLVLSSPPFLALRAYLPADHPDKAHEIGSEATPGAYIDTLLDIVEECRRVLAPHGSLAFELGDTYSGSGGAGGDYTAGGMKDGQNAFVGSSALERSMTKNARVKSAGRSNAPIRDLHGKKQPGGAGWPMEKSLCLIPESFRWALVYGRNPFTSRETPRWRARNVVRWVRPNPAVGALGDKFRPATSEMVIACMSKTRFFDLDAVRAPFTGHAGVGTGVRKGQGGVQNHDNRPDDMPTRFNTHDGAPPLDWWSISPVGYSGAHYAVYPAELCEKPVKAMCPLKVCRTCGEPSRRLSETEQVPTRRTNGRKHYASGTLTEHFDKRTEARVTTIGWTDCGHDDWRLGVVLDPFAGSGTTLAVATGHGRDAIGIDLDERNAELALERVGMFLTVEHHKEAVA